MEDYLPIGSIVKVKKTNDLFMIIGYKVYNKETKELKDYVILNYPIGLIDPNIMMQINKDDVEKVVFKGFENEESLEFLGVLKEKFDLKKLNENELNEVIAQTNVVFEKENESKEEKEEFDIF